MTSLSYLQQRAAPHELKLYGCEVLNLQDCICTSVRPMTGYTAHLWLLWWIHTVAIPVRYNNRRTCTEYMCNVPLLATGCLLSLYQLCFRQPHPSGSARTTGLMLWGAWRLGEPILVVHINNAKPLGVAHSPLKVVQEWPREVSTNINSVPAPNNWLHRSFCWLNAHSSVVDCKISLLDCLCNWSEVSFEVTDSRRVI